MTETAAQGWLTRLPASDRHRFLAEASRALRLREDVASVEEVAGQEVDFVDVTELTEAATYFASMAAHASHSATTWAQLTAAYQEMADILSRSADDAAG